MSSFEFAHAPPASHATLASQCPPIKKILVLGAYGFIGAELCRRLAADGATVTGLVRSAKTAARIIPGIVTIEADIASLGEALRTGAALLRDKIS